MDIDAKLKQRLNIFDEIDKLANKNFPVKNKDIIRTYNSNKGRTSPFIKEIACNNQSFNFKKNSKDKKTDKSTISNYDHNIIAHNYSQTSNMQSPFKDSVCSLLDYNEETKSQKVCDWSLFSPINEVYSTNEFSNNGNNTCKNPITNFSNNNFLNNIKTKNFEKKVCNNTIQTRYDTNEQFKPNLFKHCESKEKNKSLIIPKKLPSSNSKAKRKDAKGVYCKENPRNYTPDSHSGSERNNSSKSSIKYLQNKSSNSKHHKNVSFDKAHDPISQRNPHDIDRINNTLNTPNSFKAHLQNMPVTNPKNGVLDRNVINKNPVTYSNSINLLPVNVENSRPIQHKSSEPFKNNFIPKNNPNRVYEDLYNFEGQFKFSRFRPDNIDSFYALKRKYNSKSNIKGKDENQYSQNIHKRQAYKTLNRSNSGANFTSQQKRVKGQYQHYPSDANLTNHFEKLYNDSFALESKITQKKVSIENNFMRNLKPEITKKAKNIVRDPNLFHCRLYPYHKINNSLTQISDFAHRRINSYAEFDKDNKNNKLNRTFSGTNIFNKSYANMNREKNHNEVYAIDNFQTIKTHINNYQRNENYNLTNNEAEIDRFNHSFTGVYCNIVENIKKLEGIDDVRSFKIYRTSKNKRNAVYDDYEKHKSFDNKSNKINNEKYNKIYVTRQDDYDAKNPFTFAPLLNKKSLRMARKLEDSKTRLLKNSRKNSNSALNTNSKSLHQNDVHKLTFETNNNYNFGDNLNYNPNVNFNYDDKENRIYSNSFDNHYKEFNSTENTFNQYAKNNQDFYSSSFQSKFYAKKPSHYNQGNNPNTNNFNNTTNNNVKQIKNYNFIMINNIKIPARTILLYNRGLEAIKRKQAKSFEKQVKDAQLWKSYSFKPKINRRLSPQIYRGKAIKLGHSESKRNLSENSVNNLNHDFNAESIGNSIYEKQLIWKNNVDNKTKKIKTEKQIKENKECTHKPEIIKNEMPNDEKFIERNLNQIQDYVNKRRAFIQKTKEDEKYKDKRLNLDIVLKKFIKKPTIPKEFNITGVNNNKKATIERSNNLSYCRSGKYSSDEKFQENSKEKNAFNTRNGYFDHNNSESFLLNNSNSRSPFKVERKKFHSIEKFRKQYKTQEYFKNKGNNTGYTRLNDKTSINEHNDSNSLKNFEADNDDLILVAAGNFNNIENTNFNNFRRSNTKTLNFNNFKNISSQDENEFLYGEATPDQCLLDNKAQHDMSPHNPNNFDSSQKQNVKDIYSNNNEFHYYSNYSVSGKNLTFSPQNHNNFFAAVDHNNYSSNDIISADNSYNNQNYLANNLINNEYNDSNRFNSNPNIRNNRNLNFYSDKQLSPDELNYLVYAGDGAALSNQKKNVNAINMNHNGRNEKFLGSKNNAVNVNRQNNASNPLNKKSNIKIFNLLNSEAANVNNKNPGLIMNNSINNSYSNLNGKLNRKNSNEKRKLFNKTSDNIRRNIAHPENYANRSNFDMNINEMNNNMDESLGYPIDQQRFIDAVKNIHDKLVNINI